MLFFQVVLFAGYAYAHTLTLLPIRLAQNLGPNVGPYPHDKELLPAASVLGCHFPADEHTRRLIGTCA